MQLSDKRKEQPEINLTSLIDVVFLLLIFFMISTTFERASSLQVALPEASESTPEQAPQTVVLAIDARGNMALNEQRLPGNDEASIRTALTGVLPAIRRTSLTISADANVAHQHVVAVMDVAGQLGVTNLAIATVGRDKAR